MNISASPSWRNLGGLTCLIGVLVDIGVVVGGKGGLGWMMSLGSCVSPLTSSTSILGEGGEEGRCPTTKKGRAIFLLFIGFIYNI